MTDEQWEQRKREIRARAQEIDARLNRAPISAAAGVELG